MLMYSSINQIITSWKLICCKMSSQHSFEQAISSMQARQACACRCACACVMTQCCITCRSHMGNKLHWQTRLLFCSCCSCWHASRFLIDTFGRDMLSKGSGVLDIAGGKGELSFELVNLNGIQATVVEPRPLQLWRQHKWMLVSSSSNLACLILPTSADFLTVAAGGTLFAAALLLRQSPMSHLVLLMVCTASAGL